ncbi:MAG: hypothetical protein ACK4F5_13215 [Aliihoeflea sp.]
MARRPSRKAQRSATSLMLVPAVMAMRMPLLLAEARMDADVQKETMRAGSEKATAFIEGAIAAQMSLCGSAMRFWPEAMSGRLPSFLNGEAARQAMEAAMHPSGKTVRANFRRLGRKAGS